MTNLTEWTVDAAAETRDALSGAITAADDGPVTLGPDTAGRVLDLVERAVVEIGRLPETEPADRGPHGRHLDPEYRAVRAMAHALRVLQRDLEQRYLPAMKRLDEANEPGAGYVHEDVTSGGFAGLADAVAAAVAGAEGLLFIGGDVDLATYWHCGLANGDRRPGEPLSERESFERLAEEGLEAPGESWASFIRGREKAAALAGGRSS